MKKPKLYFILIGFISVVITSCAVKPVGYIPLTQNVPLLQKQYEVQGFVTAGFNHMEEQVAFSPLKHIGVIGNFYQRFDKIQNSYDFEAGIGYYKLLKNNLEFEIYGIYTKSKNRTLMTENIDHPANNPMSAGWSDDDKIVYHNFLADYTGTSLQFNFGKHFSRHFDLGLCLRYSLLNYSDFYDHTKIKNGTFGTTYEDIYLKSRYQSMCTIAPTIKVGLKNIKYFAQLGIHLNMNTDNNKNTVTPPYYFPVVFTNGIILNLNFAKKENN
jgi:hypothetical protein